MPLDEKPVGVSFSVRIDGRLCQRTGAWLRASRWTRCTDCRTWYPPEARQNGICEKCRHAADMWGQVAPDSNGL